MGLDMYLSKKIYIGAQYEHRKVTGDVNILINDKPVNIDFGKISEIKESVGYWRKANQIHDWFVRNVQSGEDNCQESYVSYDQLSELKDLCEKVLETKDATSLKPSEGFFFGSTSIDEYYFEDIKETIEILSKLDPHGDYYYQASW